MIIEVLFLLFGMMFVAADDKEDRAMYDLVQKDRVSTLSTDLKGTPFGSLVPYALTEDGVPFIFLSDMAAHTKNLKANPKCSLMMSKIDKEDVFNSARITFMGKMEKVGDKDRKKYEKIYLKTNPESETFIEFGDFNFYRLEITNIHYIGGFGDINWVEPKDYLKGFKK